MKDKVMEKDSIYLSYLLRHHPEEVGCTLDSYGWADVRTLCRNSKFTLSYLEEIVSEDTRYEFNSDMSKIRAFHGHSVSNVTSYNEVTPPSTLYHGTSTRGYELIKKDGFFRKMSRNFVYLSIDEEKAREIGKRHGKPIVLVLDSESMLKDGFKFYESGDGVILVDDFPIKYIKEELSI